LFKPMVRRSLLAQSAHWHRHLMQRRGLQWAGKTALITGASSGIGAAVARAVARQGARVVLVARRADRLELLADEIIRDGGQVHVIPADLTDEAERRRVLVQAAEPGGGVDILVNSAGLGWYGYGSDMPWEVAREMIQTNMAALAHLTLLALRDMRARGTGHIINISSVAGSLPEQGIALYGATKSFVDSFTTAGGGPGQRPAHSRRTVRRQAGTGCSARGRVAAAAAACGLRAELVALCALGGAGFWVVDRSARPRLAAATADSTALAIRTTA